MNNLDQAISIADKLKKDTERIYLEMDTNITELIRLFAKMAVDIKTPIDPKDPEELERFKNAPDGYPDSFESAQEQQTSDNQTNYKRQ